VNILRTIRAFFHRDDIAQSLNTLADCVGGLSRIVVVGGALRELTLSELCSATPEIPDIDVALLADFDSNQVIQRLGRAACTVNSFGGIKWQTAGSLTLDIWTARAWAERIGKVSRSEYRVGEIKGFLDFNVNAGIYTPYSDEVDVEDISKAVSHRILELNNSLVPPDSVQLARIIKLEHRVKDLGLDLGPELRQYVVRVINSLDLTGFAEAKTYFERKSGQYLGESAGSYFETRISQLASGQAAAIRRSRTGI
jgi:hypothetical protein